MKFLAAPALILIGLSACSGPGAVSPSGGLVYQVPENPSLVYVLESSDDASIEAGPMGIMKIEASNEMTLGVSFAQGAGGVQVTVTYQEVTASRSEPMGGTVTATESDVEGDLVFTLDRRGTGTLVSEPVVKESAKQLVIPSALVQGLFPRFPAEAVNPGGTWTDTVQVRTESGGANVSGTSVLLYTLVGDTVVDGVTLLHITFEGTTEQVGEIAAQGMDVTQTTSGEMEGMFLWDPARGVMVAKKGTTELQGTMDVPVSGMPPMPLTMKTSGTVRLQGG